MRFWGAVAVQLLAIALRDQSRSVPKANLDLCVQRPVELACHCEPAVLPEAEKKVDYWLVGIGVGTGVLVGGSIVGALSWSRPSGRDVSPQHGGSRRRGGGVLSGVETG